MNEFIMKQGRVLRIFDPWRSNLCTCKTKYSLHPYTGCSHKCLYCYASSYIGYKDSVHKKNFIEFLRRDLEKTSREIPVNLSTSSDPYPPVEKNLQLTRKSIEMLIDKGFKIVITTKSSLVTRDIDLFRKGNCVVMMTITTLDEKLSKLIEPGAPSPRERLSALTELSKNNIPVGVRIDPVIPHINDDPYILSTLVEEVYQAGVLHVVASTYKARYDNYKRLIGIFPELEKKLHSLYFEKKIFVSGYFYLPKEIRAKLLRPITKEASKLGLSYATCREGLVTKEYFLAESCDGSHLLKEKKLISKV